MDFGSQSAFMKGNTSGFSLGFLSSNNCANLGGLPRELWMMILEEVFLPLEPTDSKKSFFELSLVSSWWTKMVYESVTILNGLLVTRLTDDALARLCSLQALTVSDFHGYRKGELTWGGTQIVTNAGLRTATNLTRLDLLNGRSITDEGITGLSKLTSFTLSQNITEIGLQNLTNMTTLQLTSRQSDGSVTKLTKLTTLEAWDTKVTPGGLKLLTNLTSLSMNSRKYNYDEAFMQLNNLTFLNIGGFTQYNIGDDGLKGLSSLTHLDIFNDNGLSDIGIQNLTKLETLSLSGARNRVTDDGVSKLVNLTSLDISGNQNIGDVGISGLTKLSRLLLSSYRNPCNKIVTDYGIRNLVNLTSLSINNAITDAGILLLTNLTILDLSTNRLVTESCLKGLTKLI